MADTRSEPLLARTREITDPGDLLDLLPRRNQLAWTRSGNGIVGWGCAAVLRGASIAETGDWWRRIAKTAVVRDELRLPGTGLVSFGSFTFSESDDSVLIVPEVVVGRQADTWWVTTIGTAIAATPELHLGEPVSSTLVEFDDPVTRRENYRVAVAEAVAHIKSGELDKVVLARSVDASFAEPLDVRAPLHRLAAAYPGCWTFHVDGFFGATPELLVRQGGGLVTSRVLAGTIRRSGADEVDAALAGSLARSGKDLAEHEYAVRSVADALAPHCSAMNVPEAPYVLHLPNVMHLASDVTGVLSDGVDVLRLVEALHPSAAVGGTPTNVAVDLIDRLEGMDRGRYAGPVGWMDARGDGEWGIGLRSARLSADRRSARLYAGCGIVADSDPESELAESDAKLLPVREALADFGC